MFSKFSFVALLVAVARCSASGGSSSFSYGVSDPNTGDFKDQHEKRVGDSVVGQYSLLEADGTKRIVEYSSHPHTGFNAIVRKDPAVGVHPSSAGGFIGAASLGYGSPGYAGANPLVYSGHNAWNSANLAYARRAYGNGAYGGSGAYNSAANDWSQAGAANGAYRANGWPSNSFGASGIIGASGWPSTSGANGISATVNGWPSNAGVNAWPSSATANGLSSNIGANAWPSNVGTNAWQQNGASGAYAVNGWPQTYGGYGASGYLGHGANPAASGYGAQGANELSYNTGNSGW